MGHGGEEAGAGTLSARGPSREDAELSFAGPSLSTGVAFSPGIPCDDEFGHLRGEIFSVCAAYERTVAAERAPRPLRGHRLHAVAARTRAAREGTMEATVHLLARRACSLRRSATRPVFPVLSARTASRPARSSGAATGGGCPPVPQALCPMLVASGVPPERAAWLVRLHWAAAQASTAAPPRGDDSAGGGPRAGDYAEEMLQGWSLALGGAVLEAWGIPATALRSRADALRDRDPDAYAHLTAQILPVVSQSLPRPAAEPSRAAARPRSEPRVGTGGPSPPATSFRAAGQWTPRAAGEVRPGDAAHDASSAASDETTSLGAARAGASLLLHFASGGLMAPHVCLAAAIELVARCVRCPGQVVHPRRRRGPASGARLWHMLPAARIGDAVALAALAARVLAAAAVADSVRESLLPSHGVARHLARAVHDAAAGLSAAHSRATRARAAAATQANVLAAWRDLGGALHAAVCACPALAQDAEAMTPPLLACTAAAARPVAHPRSDSARAGIGASGGRASAQASRLADTACGRDLLEPSSQLPWPTRAPGGGGGGPGSAAERAAAALSRALAVAAARCRRAGEGSGGPQERVTRLLACHWLTPAVAAPLVRWRAAHAPLVALCPAAQAACATTLHRSFSLALSAPLTRCGDVMASAAAMVALQPCGGALQLHAATDAVAAHAGHAARELAGLHATAARVGAVGSPAGATEATRGSLEAEIAAALLLILCNGGALAGSTPRRAALLPALRPAQAVSAVVRTVVDAVCGRGGGDRSSSPLEPLVGAIARLGRTADSGGSSGGGSTYPLGACAELLPAAPLALPAWAVSAARWCTSAGGPQTDASSSVLLCAALGVLLVSGVTPLAPQGVRQALSALQSKAFSRLAGGSNSSSSNTAAAEAGAWTAPPLRNVALALTWLTAELGPDPPTEWADADENSVSPPTRETGPSSTPSPFRRKRGRRAGNSRSGAAPDAGAAPVAGGGSGGAGGGGGEGGGSKHEGWLSDCSTDDGGGDSGPESGTEAGRQAEDPHGPSPAATAWCTGIARAADRTDPAPAQLSRLRGVEAATAALCDTLEAAADATPEGMPASSAAVRAMNLFASAAGRMSLAEAGKVLDGLCAEGEAQSAFVAVRALCIASAHRGSPRPVALLACAALGAMAVECCVAGRGTRWRGVLVAATEPPTALRGGGPLPAWVRALTNAVPARAPHPREKGGGMFAFLSRRPGLRGGVALGGGDLALVAHAAFAASVATSGARYAQRHSPDPDASALLRPLRRRAVHVAACAGGRCVPTSAMTAARASGRDCLASVLHGLPPGVRSASAALEAATLAVEGAEDGGGSPPPPPPFPARDSPLLRVLRRAVAAGAREARRVLGLPSLLRLPPGATHGEVSHTEQEDTEGGRHSIPADVAPFQGAASGEAGPHSVGTPVVGTPGSGFGVPSPSWQDADSASGGNRASADSGIARAAAAHGGATGPAGDGVERGDGSALSDEAGDGDGAHGAGEGSSLQHNSHSPPAPRSRVASPASLHTSPHASLAHAPGEGGLPPSPLVPSLARSEGVSGPGIGSSSLSVSTVSVTGAAAVASTSAPLAGSYADAASAEAAGVGSEAQGGRGSADHAAVPVSSSEWAAAARQWDSLCSDAALPAHALLISALCHALAASRRRALPAAATTVVDLASLLAPAVPPAEGANAVIALLHRADAAAAGSWEAQGREVRAAASAALHLRAAATCAAALPATPPPTAPAGQSHGLGPAIAAALALATWLDATAAITSHAGARPHGAGVSWLEAVATSSGASAHAMPALEGEVAQGEEEGPEEEEGAGDHDATTLPRGEWSTVHATSSQAAPREGAASAQFPRGGEAWSGGASEGRGEGGDSFLAALTPRSARQLRTAVLCAAHQLLQRCWRRRGRQEQATSHTSRNGGARAAQPPARAVDRDAMHGAAFLLCRACAVLCGQGQRVERAPLLAALGGACPLVLPRDRGPVWAALPKGNAALVEPAASAWTALNSSWQPLPSGAGACVRVPGPAVDAELGADAFAPVGAEPDAAAGGRDGEGGGGAGAGSAVEPPLVRVVPADEMVAAALTMVPSEGDCCTAMAVPESRAQIGRAVETGAGGELVGGDDEEEGGGEGPDRSAGGAEEPLAGMDPGQATPAPKRARRMQ